MARHCGTGARMAATALGALILAAAASPAQAAEVAPLEPLEPLTSTDVSALAVIQWHTAPSLVKLRSEINARWPNRSRSSDGTIGDARHAQTTNSHNPVGTATGPSNGTRGAVHAMDITASGIDVNAVLAAVIGDSRVWYVIHAGKIWSRTYGWAQRTQYGDPHNSHIHINLREDSQAAAVAAETSTRSWFAGKTSSSPAYQATPSIALSKAQVVTLQKALIKRGFAIPAGPTGYYGPQTTKAVAAYQRSQGWTGSDADGIAGRETLRRLGVTTTTTVPTSNVTPKDPSASTTTGTPKLSKAKTKKLQKALIKRGFAIPAGATGYYGPQTKRAVKAFQRSQGWRGSDADGIAGPQTLRRLGVKPPGTTKAPTAKRKAATSTASPSAGLSQAKTKKLQKALIKRGFAIPAGATGYYGTQTKRAVKAFQRSQGWRGSDADGIAGPQTLRRLGIKPPSTTKAPTATKKTAAKTTPRKSAWNPKNATLVRALQRALIRRGHAIPAGATGFFGQQTKRAVKSFQRSQGWRGSDADGIPGRTTLARLGL